MGAIFLNKISIQFSEDVKTYDILNKVMWRILLVPIHELDCQKKLKCGIRWIIEKIYKQRGTEDTGRHTRAVHVEEGGSFCPAHKCAASQLAAVY